MATNQDHTEGVEQAVIDEAKRMSCDCQSPDYHQTGNPRCVISKLLAAQSAAHRPEVERLTKEKLMWLIVVDRWAWRFIRAEPPCWKGELQIGPLVIGWEKRTSDRLSAEREKEAKLND